ncbi:MAG TPA: peptide-methionine (R)-S-oxide reductase MsrB [Candidatus Saccharimonadales bacterium]
MQLSEDEWKAKLTPEQYRVLREKGTEAPGTGKYLYNDERGVYHCAACGIELFKSDSKYESTIPGLVGWPSFSDAVNSDAVVLSDDDSLGMRRTEVSCKNCGSHLGHLFPDDSSPNGKHFCINSVALDFEKN